MKYSKKWPRKQRLLIVELLLERAKGACGACGESYVSAAINVARLRAEALHLFSDAILEMAQGGDDLGNGEGGKQERRFYEAFGEI